MNGSELISLSIQYYEFHQLLRRKRDGAIDVDNISSIQRCYWRFHRSRLWHPSVRWKSQQTRSSHRRYVDLVIHSSLSTIYQLLFAGYRREPAWASRTVDEELGQPRPNLWKRRDEVEVSVYATPITDLGSKLISFTLSNHSIQLLFAGATMGVIQAPPMSTSAEPIVSTRTLAHTRAIASASGQHRTYDFSIVQISSLTYLCRVNHRRLWRWRYHPVILRIRLKGGHLVFNFLSVYIYIKCMIVSYHHLNRSSSHHIVYASESTLTYKPKACRRRWWLSMEKLSWFLRNDAAHVNAKFIFVNRCRKYLVGIEL